MLYLGHDRTFSFSKYCKIGPGWPEVQKCANWANLLVLFFPIQRKFLAKHVNIVRIANAVLIVRSQWLSEFRFSIVRIVISVWNDASLQDCQDGKKTIVTLSKIVKTRPKSLEWCARLTRSLYWLIRLIWNGFLEFWVDLFLGILSWFVSKNFELICFSDFWVDLFLRFLSWLDWPC